MTGENLGESLGQMFSRVRNILPKRLHNLYNQTVLGAVSNVGSSAFAFYANHFLPDRKRYKAVKSVVDKFVLSSGDNNTEHNYAETFVRKLKSKVHVSISTAESEIPGVRR